MDAVKGSRSRNILKDPQSRDALYWLGRNRKYLTAQQYKTLRGQIFAGRAQDAMRGLHKIKTREAGEGDNTTRQSPGNSDRQQPKD